MTSPPSGCNGISLRFTYPIGIYFKLLPGYLEYKRSKKSRTVRKQILVLLRHKSICSFHYLTSVLSIFAFFTSGSSPVPFLWLCFSSAILQRETTWIHVLIDYTTSKNNVPTPTSIVASLSLWIWLLFKIGDYAFHQTDFSVDLYTFISFFYNYYLSVPTLI